VKWNDQSDLKSPPPKKGRATSDSDDDSDEDSEKNWHEGGWGDSDSD